MPTAAPDVRRLRKGGRGNEAENYEQSGCEHVTSLIDTRGQDLPILHQDPMSSWRGGHPHRRPLRNGARCCLGEGRGRQFETVAHGRSVLQCRVELPRLGGAQFHHVDQSPWRGRQSDSFDPTVGGDDDFNCRGVGSA